MSGTVPAEKCDLKQEFKQNGRKYSEFWCIDFIMVSIFGFDNDFTQSGNRFDIS